MMGDGLFDGLTLRMVFVVDAQTVVKSKNPVMDGKKLRPALVPSYHACGRSFRL